MKEDKPAFGVDELRVLPFLPIPGGGSMVSLMRMRKPAMPLSDNLHRLATGLSSLARRCCALLVAFSLTMATLGYPAGAAHAASRNADMLAVHQNLQLRLGHLPIRVVGVTTTAAEAPARGQNKSKKSPKKTGWIQKHWKVATNLGVGGASGIVGALVTPLVTPIVATTGPVALAAGTIGWLASYVVTEQISNRILPTDNPESPRKDANSF